MKNESLSYFASKIFDFFKPLPPLPPTPPDALDLSICYGSLIALACTSVYCGSIGSLPYHQRHKDRDAKGGYDDSDEEDEVLEEKITTDDAWLFPILGSCMLFGLYLLLRYLGPEWVNEILRYWFAFMSWGAVFKTSNSLARFALGEQRWKASARYTFNATRKTHNSSQAPSTTTSSQPSSSPLFTLTLRTPALFLTLPFSLLPPLIYLSRTSSHATSPTPPIVFNILSLSLAHTALTTLKLDRFMTGAVLLSGLFLYDVFWVFGSEKVVGTNVMVTVATALDAPIKILFPKSKYLFLNNSHGFALLGGGDIIVPGLWCALCLRYDWSRSPLASENTQRPQERRRVPVFDKPFFATSLVAYVLGLGTTICAMQWSQAAQPALLYISPACLLATFLTAYFKGAWTAMWAWVDESIQSASEGEQGSEKPRDAGANRRTVLERTIKVD